MAMVARFKAFMDHPAGPKTIFFWAPAAKWCLVSAGLGDINRPAEKISLAQSGSLTATGIIWTRYSLVIIPKNWNLAAVNFFVFLTGMYQFSRALIYQYKTNQLSIGPAPVETKSETKTE